MADYILSGESTADISKEHFEKRNIKYACFHFRVGDKEYIDDLGQTLPYEEFYKEVAAGALTQTSQINVDEYVNYFEPFLKEGKDIVHVTLSSGISGTVNSARSAKQILEEKYPERKIYVVDSLGASSGLGLLMDTAATKRDEGMDGEHLAQWIEQNRLHVHHWFFSTDLSAYVRGGRISKTAGVFGGILEICPLLNMDALGRLIPREKIRKKKNVIKAIVDRMEEHALNGTNYTGKVYMSQSDCLEDAQQVAKLVEERFPHMEGKVEINWIGTTIGSHTGIGTVALFFFGDERVL